jgi:alkylation response protein AidB-like acyl-CoA dehydrogenase
VSTAVLDLHLTADERELYEDTRALARSRLAAVADTGRPGRVNRALVRELGDAGLLPRLFANEAAIKAIELCLIREALARECTDAETLFGVQGLGAYPILQNGPAELRSDWIPRLADGSAVAHAAGRPRARWLPAHRREAVDLERA